MSRIQSLNHRYFASALLVRTGVEVVVVGDPAGAQLNKAVRRLLVSVRDDGPGLWDDLVGAARALRWRVMTQPQPLDCNPALRHGVEQVARQVRRLRGAVASEPVLDELAVAAQVIGETDPVLGPFLLRSIEEVGPTDCIVVAANKPARLALAEWLGESGVGVLTAGELERRQPRVEQAYVVGPPRFCRTSLVTAPVTDGVSFLLPAWFGDRSIPCSAIAPYAEGAIRIVARVFSEGDLSEPGRETAETDVEDDFLPQPLWGNRRSPDREPAGDEVEARKVLLSGGLAIWLDDGDRIRALDPDQPSGERVTYAEVDAVRPGTHLLLRQGEAERGALYRAALALMSSQGTAVDASQRAWKERLSRSLQERGYREAVRELRNRGVKAADRARAWTDPHLVRPHGDHDFEVLLQWLGVPIQPSFGYATMLRRTLHRASADVREQLETAVSAADLAELEREGQLSLEVNTMGFRGIVATRVLALSPYREIVARRDARVPFEDRSGQWLE